ncbi:hypothetical protein BHE74_00037595 [Ensete ventricosum]|nr:hypothetical protein BHE74_00037595 [Ensete ventricosum]
MLRLPLRRRTVTAPGISLSLFVLLLRRRTIPSPPSSPFRRSSPASPTPSSSSLFHPFIAAPRPSSPFPPPSSTSSQRPPPVDLDSHLHHPPTPTASSPFSYCRPDSPPLRYPAPAPTARISLLYTTLRPLYTSSPPLSYSLIVMMKLMQKDPRILRATVETVLKPRMRSLQDMGFSDTEIVQLVSSCPTLLYFRDIQRRINFWRSLLGSNERLIKASRRQRTLLSASLSQKIEPNISILREFGISKQCIAKLVATVPSFFCRTNKSIKESIKESIKHVEDLGVSRDCKTFPRVLLLVMTTSKSKFDATFATLMSFGWSQPDCIAALRRYPSIWCFSEKNLRDKMTFLMEEAGCEPTYISCRPVLLTYSLEKRLRPRYEVLNFLEQNKLLDKEHNLLSVVTLSEEKFGKKFLFLLRKEKFIAPYDSYVAAVLGKHLDVAEN